MSIYVSVYICSLLTATHCRQVALDYSTKEAKRFKSSMLACYTMAIIF
jgi:hypothetical protein